MKEKLLEEFRRYVDHYDNMQGLLIVRIAEKDIESIIDQAYEAGRESMKEEWRQEAIRMVQVPGKLI